MIEHKYFQGIGQAFCWSDLFQRLEAGKRTAKLQSVLSSPSVRTTLSQIPQNLVQNFMRRLDFECCHWLFAGAIWIPCFKHHGMICCAPLCPVKLSNMLVWVCRWKCSVHNIYKKATQRCFLIARKHAPVIMLQVVKWGTMLEVFGESCIKVFSDSPPPPIDGLIRVPDHKQISSRSFQELENLVFKDVCVLSHIHNQGNSGKHCCG